MQESEHRPPSVPVRSSTGLLPLVYAELRRLAHQYMARERPDHVLESAALVHEAYMRIAADHENSWANGRQFFSAAAEAMRRILVEEARARARLRRGGQHARVPLRGADLADTDDPDRVIAVDELLERLMQSNPRGAEIVRLRFYAGLGEPEIAALLELSERTVRREWAHAQSWLQAALRASG
jgi:RNA polymerase sigma factor (TIGR02999 family)